MNNLFEFSYTTLNDIINYLDGLSYDSEDVEEIRRLERAHDYLNRAFVVLTPLYYKKRKDN